MSTASNNPVDFCYRHPSSRSYVLCQRCGRTICPSCQTQASVGVHCPECVKEARQNAPKRQSAVVSAFRTSSNQPVVSYTLIGLTVLVYILQLIPGSEVSRYLTYYPALTSVEPWTMLTALFVHGSIFHILVNMYSLLIFGPILERLVGRSRFLALYLIAGFGGSVAVLILAPDRGVLGASGAIFGLLGAFFVIQRRLGGNNIQLLLVIGLNLAIGFVLPGISWQAHLGGLLAGGAVALVYLQTRQANQKHTQILMVTGIAVALIAATVVRVFAG